MMKYFTKYLPVEGEIKENDTFIITNPRIQDHPSGLIRTCYHIIKDQGCWSEKNQNWTSEKCDFLYIDPLESEFWGFVERHHAKKAKLFLCTKNVNIDDNTIDGIIKKEKLNDFIFENGKCLQKSLCYKVIGEISPNAVWVTEGIEFDEDEVKESYVITNDKRSSSYNLHWYRIKCPTCKQFH